MVADTSPALDRIFHALAVVFMVSNLCLQYGAARLPANTTSVIMLSEVVFASVTAVALGAGHLGPREAVGALMIVSAAWLVTRPSPGCVIVMRGTTVSRTTCLVALP